MVIRIGKFMLIVGSYTPDVIGGNLIPIDRQLAVRIH